jgi:hypothetical protein
MEMTTNETKIIQHRGGRVKEPRKYKPKVTGTTHGKTYLNLWHDFYASVKDYEIFSYYPKRKRVAVSLFKQGMERHNMSAEEMKAIIEDTAVLHDFPEYLEYMKLPMYKYIL